MATIKHKRQEILQKIDKVLEQRDIKQNIKLVAVSKTFAINNIIEAMEAGQIDFAENYVKEGVEKITQLKTLAPLENLETSTLIWHFIGKIQSNKTELIAQNFDWVHTIDREKIAVLLNNARFKQSNNLVNLDKLQVCIQVNIDNSESKGGIVPIYDEILNLAKYIASLPNLNLRGLMAIPDMLENNLPNQQAFKDMHKLFIEIQKKLINVPNTKNFDTLCMGMSQDFELAIQNGATMLRIGSAIFGTRD